MRTTNLFVFGEKKKRIRRKGAREEARETIHHNKCAVFPLSPIISYKIPNTPRGTFSAPAETKEPNAVTLFDRFSPPLIPPNARLDVNVLDGDRLIMKMDGLMNAAMEVSTGEIEE